MKTYARILLASVAALTFAGSASAHAVWLERDGTGPVRIYLNEIAPKTEEADETHRLKSSVILTDDPARPTALVHKDKHFEAAVTGKSDVRLRNDSAFAPWVDDGKKHGQVYHARAGRTETTAKLDFELVPVKSGGKDFTLLLRGKPVANSEVSVFSPSRVETKLTTDAAGRITVPEGQSGRYIIEASTNEDGAFTVGGESVVRLVHVTTLSYVKS